MNHSKRALPAFTIIELLTVIVIIGILASIAAISYSSIRTKAIASNIEAKLVTGATKLKSYRADHGSYPISLDSSHCPNAPVADSRYCISEMNDSTMAYYGGGQSFNLTITHTPTGLSYYISESGVTAKVTTGSIYAIGGNTLPEYGTSVEQLDDGNVILAGATHSYGAGGRDALLVKFDSDDKVLWTKTWGGSGNDRIWSVKKTSDGGFVVAGETNSFGAGNFDAFIAKYNSNGGLIWDKTWGGTGIDNATSVIQTSDGGFAMVGLASSFGSVDAFIAKYNSSGTLIWDKTWGGAGIDSANCVTETTDGEIAVVGETGSYGAGGNDAFVIKYKLDGTPSSWGHDSTWGGAGSESANSVVPTSDGGVVVVGEITSVGAGGKDAFATKYNSNATISWNIVFGGSGDDSAVSVAKASDGGYIVDGDTLSYGMGSGDIFYLKLSYDGSLLWAKTWGGSLYENAGGIIQLSGDRSYAMAGSTNSYKGGDAIYARFSPEGNAKNCSSPMCQIINPSTTTSSSGGQLVSGTSSSPAANDSDPSASTDSPTSAVTTIVAP